MPGDTFNALISQIQAAANVWNGVPTSAARLNFAGMSPMTQPMRHPKWMSFFDGDIAPGLLAYTQITTTQNVAGILAGGSDVRSRAQHAGALLERSDHQSSRPATPTASS